MVLKVKKWISTKNNKTVIALVADLGYAEKFICFGAEVAEYLDISPQRLNDIPTPSDMEVGKIVIEYAV